MPTPFRSAVSAPGFVLAADPLTATEPAAGVLATDTISEATSAAGVTIDGLLLKDGVVMSDQFVVAEITVGNATGGATGAALTLQLRRLDGSTAIGSARQVMIRALQAQYQPIPPAESSVTFGTATTGSIIGSGAAWALIETSATGAFACTATNIDDETSWFRAISADSVSAVGKGCIVLACVADFATWSA